MPYIDFLPTGGGSGKDISKATVTLVSNSFVYDGTEKTQAISSVTYKGVTLVEGADYIVIAGSNKAINAGTHTISIAGIVNYCGVKNVDWTIAKAGLTQPTVSVGTYTYDGTAQGPTITGFDDTKMNKSGDSATNAGNYTLSITVKDSINYQWSSGSDISQAWSISKAQGVISASPSSVTVSLNDSTTSTLTVIGDGTVSVSSSAPAVIGASVSGTTVTITGLNDGNATITVTLADGTNYLGATCTISAAIKTISIYGVEWNGTSTTSWTRTDDAENFTDPVPYVSGASSYGSPFDTLQPWAGMTVSEDSDVGTLVAIPKFWYKITQNGSAMKIQIADGEVDGFSVSPAHLKRGSETTDRDVVYIGRYHCGATAYKSVSGQKPIVNITRSTARSNIHNLGSDIWQCDWAMRFTLFLLYLVEFADWNTQTKIGYGCGNGSAVQIMGASDSMPYHTGTMQSSRTTYGVGTQYRNIEGLWDNCVDWIDGCVNTSSGLKIIMNPSDFSDSTSSGTSVGTPSSGYPSAFSVKNVSGTFPLFIPSSASGSKNTYSCDSWNFDSSYPCVCAGGYYSQSLNCGLFYWGYNGSSNSYDGIGSRFMKLP